MFSRILRRYRRTRIACPVTSLPKFMADAFPNLGHGDLEYEIRVPVGTVNRTKSQPRSPRHGSIEVGGDADYDVYHVNSVDRLELQLRAGAKLLILRARTGSFSVWYTGPVSTIHKEGSIGDTEILTAIMGQSDTPLIKCLSCVSYGWFLQHHQRLVWMGDTKTCRHPTQ